MGESGQNEFLRGPLALFGVRSGARLVKNLANHRRTPMSPAELILPPSPREEDRRDQRLRQGYRPRPLACGG